MNRTLLISLVFVALTFGVGDIVTTIIALEKLGIEAEGACPAKNVVDCFGICGLIIFKFLVTAALCALIFILYKRGLPITALGTVLIASILGIVIIINNSLAILFGFTIITPAVPVAMVGLGFIIYWLEDSYSGT